MQASENSSTRITLRVPAFAPAHQVSLTTNTPCTHPIERSSVSPIRTDSEVIRQTHRSPSVLCMICPLNWDLQQSSVNSSGRTRGPTKSAASIEFRSQFSATQAAWTTSNTSRVGRRSSSVCASGIPTEICRPLERVATLSGRAADVDVRTDHACMASYAPQRDAKTAQ